MRKLLLILIAALVAPIVAQPALAADKIYVMRHLQKAEGTDPPLSAEGAANAQLLAGLLAKSGIKAIFATPTKRAMETGDPLAKALKISITSYDPRNPDELVKAVDALKGSVLIVGHSNTVPVIVTRFGGTAVPLTDQDYGTVFVVTPGKTTVKQIVVKTP